MRVCLDTKLFTLVSPYLVTAIFNDGRFGSSIFASLFQNFSCANEPTATSLTECVISDRCQSNCQYPIGLRCYGRAK